MGKFLANVFSANPLILLVPLLVLTTSSHIDQNGTDIPFYALEEHWLSPSLAQQFVDNPLNTLVGAGAVIHKLQEVGPNRLASMDANNIHIQIVSHVPSPEALSAPELTQLANDELAAAIAASPEPSRFRGFCVLPMALPEEAADELQRCINKLGFAGALVDAHLGNGSYYDGPAYDTLWAAAVQLKVPIYMHPTHPALADVINIGTGLYAPLVQDEYSLNQAAVLGMPAWGWHERTGLGFLRMYLGGVFDRFPELQIILGHMGELVPYFLARSDFYLSGNRTLSLKDVYAHNVYVTTSGMFSLDPMTTVVRTTNTKRIMFSVDWPFARNEDGVAFMQALRESGMVSEEEFEDIAFRNAERLLRL